MKSNFLFDAKLWIWKGQGAWHFVTVPQKISKEIKELYGKKARGWGSLPVSVTIGKTTWKTSIFPDSKSGTYLLPIKVEVRKKESVQCDDVVRCKLLMQ